MTGREGQPIRPPYTLVELTVTREPAWGSQRDPYVIITKTDAVDGETLSFDRITSAQARELAARLIAAADALDATKG